MNITDNFKNMLYEILDDISVGDVQFGVLKTFYEDDVHKLYDELIDTLPEDKLKKIDTALQRVGSKMFLYYLYKYRITIDPSSQSTEDKDCIKLAYLFDNRIRLAVFDKLHELSSTKMKVDVTFEGIAQHNINYTEFTSELYALAKRYGLEVSSFNNPPMRFLNKYELEEMNNEAFN